MSINPSFQALFFNGKSADGILHNVRFEKDFITLFDQNGEVSSQYPIFNLFRQFLAEENDIRIGIRPKGYLVFDKSHELLDLMQSKVPILTKPSAPAPEFEKKIRNIGLSAWGILGFMVFIWPLLAIPISNLFTPQFEEKISKSLEEEFTKDDLFLRKQYKATGAILDAKMNLLAQKENIPHKISTSLIRDDIFNAFALPGGRIVLYCGLVNKMDNAQLSFVLSHELAHVKNRDALHYYVKGLGANALLSLISGTGFNVNAQFAKDMNNLSYSRGLEENADKTGVNILKASNFNANGAPKTFDTFIKFGYGYSFGIDTLFASHPNPKIRKEKVEKQIIGHNGNDLLSENDYLKVKTACLGEGWDIMGGAKR